MRKFVEGLGREKLVAFIVEYAERDAKFANALKVRFCRPEFSEELGKLESAIDRALRGVSDYYYSRDREGCVNFNVRDILTEIVLRVEQGYVRLAFAEVELLYRKLLEKFEYQDECEISDEAEKCLEIMAMIAGKAVDEVDKGYIFRQCLVLVGVDDGKDYGADYEDKLLRIAAEFVTLDNFSDLDKALLVFEAQEWRSGDFKLIRLEVIRRLEGEKAVDAFVAENLQFPKIREIAFKKAMLDKNFVTCEQLCVDALALYSERPQYFGISPWLYKLFSVYELMKNDVKLSETAEVILLKGNLEYYDKLKFLLKNRNVWDTCYAALLCKCELQLSCVQYMEILAKEKEWALLLEQVKKHSEQIYRYGKLLAEKYVSDVCSVFTWQIRKEANVACCREAYKLVCLSIVCFAEAGYNMEAAEMKNALKVEYKRKPAFVDELNKIGDGLL
ncbi:MAG: hypothetical protein FWD52_03965 [Candidatus Bathyarchaeota archaeon]|nr:hypothetical protein [Candidatus Termiticorpusculum sp.]